MADAQSWLLMPARLLLPITQLPLCNVIPRSGGAHSKDMYNQKISTIMLCQQLQMAKTLTNVQQNCAVRCVKTLCRVTVQTNCAVTFSCSNRLQTVKLAKLITAMMMVI